MPGRRFVVGLVIAVVALTTACQPISLINPVPSTPCYVGTFTLDAIQFTAPVPTPLGTVAVTSLPGSTATLTAANDGTWALTAVLNVAVTAVSGSGQATVEGSASGTYTSTGATTLSFAVTSLTGTVAVTGTFGGQPVNATVSLPGSGLDEAVGLTGAATYACGTSSLSLTFTSVHFDF